MEKRAGIVGIGLMGQAITSNLIKAGFSLRGYDIDRGRMKEFEAQGGKPVTSAAEAARGVRWLLTSLPNSTVVREAVFGPGGVAEGAEKGLFLVDTTTSRPDDSVKIGAELGSKGIRFLDASVSGTSTMAWSKDLIVIAGGEPADFEACRPLFDGFTKAAYHMGSVGSGALTKLIINLVLEINRLGLAEGLTLGAKAGLNLETLLTVLKDGAAGSKTMDQKGERMIKGNYKPEGRLRTALKDVRLMLEQGQRFGTPLLAISLFHELIQAGVQMGYGDSDSCSLIEVLRQMAGLPLRK